MNAELDKTEMLMNLQNRMQWTEKNIIKKYEILKKKKLFQNIVTIFKISSIDFSFFFLLYIYIYIYIRILGFVVQQFPPETKTLNLKVS